MRDRGFKSGSSIQKLDWKIWAAAEFLRDPGRHIIKSDAELITSSTPPSKPFWDPRFKNEPGLLDQFVEDLASVELTTWRRRCNSFVGCFFVRKQADQIRLVDDCRATNEVHRRPPYSDLATPGALANLWASDEWVDLCEARLGLSAAEAAAPSRTAANDALPGDPVTIFGGGVDLMDGFYQFLLPELASWFGLGVRRRAGDLGLRTVYNEETRSYDDVNEDECFGALPMGWSWALFFCHRALCEASLRAQRRLGLGGRLVGDRAPPPALGRDRAICAPYVDNGNVLGTSRSAVSELLELLCDELTDVGFVVQEKINPTVPRAGAGWATASPAPQVLAVLAALVRPARDRAEMATRSVPASRGGWPPGQSPFAEPPRHVHPPRRLLVRGARRQSCSTPS